MSNTFEELRADLARFVGMFHTGTVEAGSDKIIVDRAGLAPVTEADALNAGLAYIRAAGAAAPEAESQWIDDYVPVVHPSAAEVVLNPGFETAGAGGADVFADWTESAGDGAITSSGLYITGAASCQLAAGATANTLIRQTITITPEVPYLLEFYHQSPGATGAGRWYLLDVNNNFYLQVATTLATGNDWQKVQFSFVTAPGGSSIILAFLCPLTNLEGMRVEDVSIKLCGYISLASELTAAVAADDTYEVYLAPLSLVQWNQAINDAIKAAWPQVFSRELWDTASREVSEYLLPDGVEGVLEVAVAFRGQYAGEPTQTIPGHLWRVEGTPGTDFNLQLHRIVPAAGRDLHVYYKAKYAELAAGESTDIDHEYVMLAAAAKLYHMLAAEAGPQSASARYLQLLNYYDKEAKERRDLVEGELLGLPIESRRQRGKRRE